MVFTFLLGATGEGDLSLSTEELTVLQPFQPLQGSERLGVARHVGHVPIVLKEHWVGRCGVWPG